jgi:phenylacetate-coenzyme A ligase PaaK-like adenylate-forming protein
MTPHLDLASPLGRSVWAGRLLAPLDDEKFNDLARKLFAFQFARVPAYRRLCLAHDVTPKTLASWQEIPAVPQQLFKREKLFAHGKRQPAAIYETSGTTTGQPGRQHLLSTDIYEWISVAGVRNLGLFSQVRFLHFLAPAPTDAPHSSLSAMFGFWHQHHGAKRGKFWMKDASIDFTALRETLAAQIKEGTSVGIAGTAFSFVHLLDTWKDLPPLKLPHASWLLETGGFKGRSREVSKPDLYRQLARAFGLRDVAIYNEYGMSELSSQAYAHGAQGGHRLPPWARVLVVDPATNREVRIGQRGLVRWIDLANVDSVLALQTLDLAERTANGFQLIGRMPRTEPRGCSLSMEDLNPRVSVALRATDAAEMIAARSPALGQRGLPRRLHDHP